MNKAVNNKGSFIISLDFEIYWGVWDVVDFHQYKNNLLGVRQVIPRLLKVFHEYEINATFATVGLLFFKDRQELEEGLPTERPVYTNVKISPYKNHLSGVGNDESDDPFHYAPSLVELIQNSGQEIACHTFCHYYCLEQGQTVEAFAADLKAAKKIAVKRGIDLKSLVFPRNQFNEQYLEVCKNEGFISYRGNEASWIYKAHIHERETLLRRVSRWLDAYINLTGHHCFDVERDKGFPVDIPASRFLRPYSKKMSFLDGIKLKRIKEGMTHAAKNGLNYHLWWHPHNFGINLEKNISFLEKILAHYKILSGKYDFRSRSMQQVAELNHQ